MRLIDADKLKEHIDKLPALPDGNFAGNHSALKALINMQPTIEQPTNCSEFPNNSDTISRQEAIDALNEVVKDHSITDFDAIASILDLPSAQSEIIRCKDCKYAHITYGGEVKYCDIWFSNESHYIDTDNYCSFAERRTDG